jgi:LmbE family N-acetylglucosaminyl deacetylase
LGSVLYIAAHPDDENTRLLAYLAQEKHYRTGYSRLTRGDGGQNLIGNEQSELLGLIRTQELLAARRVDGAEQFFSRAHRFWLFKEPRRNPEILG